jgi:L-ribulose-5-phosphate 4-epimerase
MLKELKAEVCHANLELVREGLVIQTWGNVSGQGLMVIKPSGVPYDAMKPSHMVVVSLETGQTLGGDLKPSSDTATHLALYRAFPGIGGVVHTHSLYATAWAQTCLPVPALGTTHADYFYGPIPCTRSLRADEIREDYEHHTGRVIIEAFRKRDPLQCPAVVGANHGPFAWGADVPEAVHNAVVLEYVIRLAGETLRVRPNARPMPQALLDKHFLRKHGPGAYYGQGATNSKSKRN